MAAALPVLFFLHIFTLSAMASASEQVLPQTHPHITGCFSTNMETFRCRWNVGTFRNLSEPGALRLFYINNKPPPASPKDWSECPHYSTDRPNECFFNEIHTSTWTYYSVQLRSKNQTTLYDENLFYINDIVQPDPPVGLNWNLLNMSITGTYCDIMVGWKAPQSADVEMGWMALQYEVQYRNVNSDLWEKADLVKITHRSIFGLQTDVNHEVRVRCKMFGGKEFGEFSDSVFVHVPFTVSRFPVVALLIFGALCLVTILMLVIISQQEKLMVILLPPVPGPKIRGIDPELLKKGKLRELTSILGGPLDLRPELYNNDPWVEFIDLDIEEHNDRLTDLDTDCLMERSLSSNCSPLSIGFRDDDSGRASYCDPDLPGDPEPSSLMSLLPNQTHSKESSCPTACEPSSEVQIPATGEPCFVAPGREALYTQVSEVRSSGKVLLSHEEETKMGKEKEKTEFQFLAAYPDHGGYTSELNAGNVSPILSPGDGTCSSPSLSRYQKSDTTPMSPLSPAPVYTIVEAVGKQNSLLLTPNSIPAPQLIIPKIMPTPDGYLTPELLGSVTP
uniref:Growth hormone receptor 2 n=1 Tax=Scorpaenichthys marmoratus TaxID=52273 RepID=A0A650CD62_9TELE|nr:growth hormone receptor 2 [Scorpaenichthys marmoratus]